MRPVISLCHEAGSNRILPDIFPFLIVMHSMPELRVPEIQLPNRLFLRARPAAGSDRLPVAHPLAQRARDIFHWRAKQVQMIRHDDEASHRPTGRLMP